MAQIVYQPEIDGDRPILEQVFPDGNISTSSVAVTVINKVTDAVVATTAGTAAQSAVDPTLWLYDTSDITGINLETVAFAQLALVFTATLSTGGTIARRQTLVVNGAALGLSRTRFQGAVHIDTTGGGTAGTAFPIGTPEVPVSNLADAVTIAAAVGLRAYKLRGSITLISAHTDWRFEGWAGITSATIDAGAQNVDGASFYDLVLTGALSGTVWAQRCDLDNLTGLAGAFMACCLLNTITVAVGSSLTLTLCCSKIPSAAAPVIDLGAGTSASLSVRGYSGGIDLRNLDQVGDNVTLEYIAGQAILAASCTAGSVSIRGICQVTDNSAGSTVNVEASLARTPIQSLILNDTTPFAGADIAAILADTSVIEPLVSANLDATVSSRATQADILADATPFNGADIGSILADTAAMQPLVDVAVSTRAAPGDAMTLTAAAVVSLVDDVWDEDLVAAHGTADTAGLLLRALAALISQRTNNPTLGQLLGVADTAGKDLPEQIDEELTAAHGAGAWDGTASDWTAGERENIRDALGVTGTKTAATGGQLQTLAARLDQLQLSVETTAAAGSTATEIRTPLTNADDFYNDMQVVIVNAAGVVARNVDDYAQVNGAFTVGALPFTPTTGDTVFVFARTGSVPVDIAGIVTALLDELLAGYTDPGSVGEALNRLDDIQAKTDNLPADPASEAVVLAAIITSENSIRGADGDDLKTLSDQIDAIVTDEGYELWSAMADDQTDAKMAFWLERNGQRQTAATSMTVTIRKCSDASVVFAFPPNTSPDAQGVFYFETAVAGFPYHEPLYADVEATDGSTTWYNNFGMTRV